MMDSDEVARRLAATEDMWAIANLKAHYCHLLDTRRAAEAGALFTEDGVWDGGEMYGSHEGRENVSAYFVNLQTESLLFAMHCVSSPFVELRGPDAAFGRWYLTMPCTFRGPQGDRAVWGSAIYEDDFVRRGGRWQVQRMTVTSQFWTPYASGWVEQPFIGVGD